MQEAADLAMHRAQAASSNTHLLHVVAGTGHVRLVERQQDGEPQTQEMCHHEVQVSGLPGGEGIGKVTQKHTAAAHCLLSHSRPAVISREHVQEPLWTPADRAPFGSDVIVDPSVNL